MRKPTIKMHVEKEKAANGEQQLVVFVELDGKRIAKRYHPHGEAIWANRSQLLEPFYSK